MLNNGRGWLAPGFGTCPLLLATVRSKHFSTRDPKSSKKKTLINYTYRYAKKPVVHYPKFVQEE